jgi:hypothetical protein
MGKRSLCALLAIAAVALFVKFRVHEFTARMRCVPGGCLVVRAGQVWVGPNCSSSPAFEALRVSLFKNEFGFYIVRDMKAEVPELPETVATVAAR